MCTGNILLLDGTAAVQNATRCNDPRVDALMFTNTHTRFGEVVRDSSCSPPRGKKTLLATSKGAARIVRENTFGQQGPRFFLFYEIICTDKIFNPHSSSFFFVPNAAKSVTRHRLFADSPIKIRHGHYFLISVKRSSQRSDVRENTCTLGKRVFWKNASYSHFDKRYKGSKDTSDVQNTHTRKQRSP